MIIPRVFYQKLSFMSFPHYFMFCFSCLTPNYVWKWIQIHYLRRIEKLLGSRLSEVYHERSPEKEQKSRWIYLSIKQVEFFDARSSGSRFRIPNFLHHHHRLFILLHVSSNWPIELFPDHDTEAFYLFPQSSHKMTKVMFLVFPHKELMAMFSLLQGISLLCSPLSFHFHHNKTSTRRTFSAIYLCGQRNEETEVIVHPQRDASSTSRASKIIFNYFFATLPWSFSGKRIAASREDESHEIINLHRTRTRGSRNWKQCLLLDVGLWGGGRFGVAMNEFETLNWFNHKQHVWCFDNETFRVLHVHFTAAAAVAWM